MVHIEVVYIFARDHIDLAVPVCVEIPEGGKLLTLLLIYLRKLLVE